MAAGPPPRQAGCRYYAARHDLLSRLAGASRLLAARRSRRQAEQMRAATTDARLSDPRILRHNCDIGGRRVLWH